MIVLDEELQGLGLEEAISAWYRGSVPELQAQNTHYALLNVLQ